MRLLLLMSLLFPSVSFGQNPDSSINFARSFLSSSLFYVGYFGTLPKAKLELVEGVQSCGAVTNGTNIFLYPGDGKTCADAASIPDLSYHEYTHIAFNALLHSKRIPNSMLSEALADVVSAVLTNNPKFSVGYKLNRHMSWIRDLSEKRIYPRDFGGLYTGSLTISSALWRVFKLSETGAPEDKLVFIGLLLKTLSTLPKYDSLFINGFAQDFLDEIDASLFSIRKIKMQAKTIFVEHGLIPGNSIELLPGSEISTIEFFSILDETKDIGSRIVLPLKIDKAKNIELRVKVDHPFSQDLVFSIQSADGKLIDFYHGQEELRIPSTFHISKDLFEIGEAPYSLVIEDTHPNFDGRILSVDMSKYGVLYDDK